MKENKKAISKKKRTNVQKESNFLTWATCKLLTKYHSTIVVLDCEPVYVQGSLAISPIVTSILGVACTVTPPLQTVEEERQIRLKTEFFKNKDFVWSHFITVLQ